MKYDCPAAAATSRRTGRCEGRSRAYGRTPPSPAGSTHDLALKNWIPRIRPLEFFRRVCLRFHRTNAWPQLSSRRGPRGGCRKRWPERSGWFRVLPGGAKLPVPGFVWRRGGWATRGDLCDGGFSLTRSRAGECAPISVLAGNFALTCLLVTGCGGPTRSELGVASGPDTVGIPPLGGAAGPHARRAHFPAVFKRPEGKGPFPAVIVLHG